MKFSALSVLLIAGSAKQDDGQLRSVLRAIADNSQNGFGGGSSCGGGKCGGASPVPVIAVTPTAPAAPAAPASCGSSCSSGGCSSGGKKKGDGSSKAARSAEKNIKNAIERLEDK